MPDEVANIRMIDINENVFRSWLRYINALKLSGITVRNYKTVLIGLNQYLGDNKYYQDSDLDRRVDITLSRTPIKPKNTDKRKDRRVPTIQDIEKIVDYYENEGLGDFKNFYWYVLWYVLFYSGCRVSELIALQWRFIDLSRDTIDIRNSISEREIQSNVINRVAQEIYRTKNIKSSRIIPIFAKYSTLLLDYKMAYKYHFKLKSEQLDDCFVFPLVLKTKEDINDYQKQKNILRELDRVCKIQGVEKTDAQMLRHGCATWMVSDREDGGLGFTEAQAKDYFGHTSDDMLSSVYAKLDKYKTARRTISTFYDLMAKKPIEDDEEVNNLKDLSNLVLQPALNAGTVSRARQKRILDEIRRLKRYEFEDWAYDDVERACVDAIKNGINLDKVELVWLHEKDSIIMNEKFKEIAETELQSNEL